MSTKLPAHGATKQDEWGCITQLETHFGGWRVRCLTERPPHAGALLAEAAQQWPEAEALVDGDHRWTYRDLDAQVSRIAAQVNSHGVSRGDRVALYLANSAEFVILLLACTRLGAVSVPLSPRYRQTELKQAFEDAAPRILVYGAELAEHLPLSCPSTPSLRVSVDAGVEGALRFEGLPAPITDLPAVLSEDDAWAILYTSGTTGRPKGAMQTHLGIVHGALQFKRCWKLGPGERSILAVPGTHAAGLGVIFTMLACGGCTVVVRHFSSTAFLALAKHERMSYAAMVPAMYSLLLRDPTFDPQALSSWRVGGYGAAPMPPALIETFATHMPKLHLVNAYGCTETTQPPVLMPLGHTAAHADSVGRLVPGAEMRIVDNAGCDVVAGQPGEIWMRGPTIIPSYWRRPEADADAFTDSWWHSGDVGSIDADGYVHVHDRLKDMIVRGGYKIFSAEVEHLLALHDAVIESAIIGVPDPVLGERVHAVVVLRDPHAVTQDGLLRWCAARLADYKVPERWTLQTEALPRNANGKTEKKLLRDRLAAPR